MEQSDPRPRRRGRPRKEAAGDARARITEAAAAEFAERGYDAATLRAIARRAGVDPALLHHYFDSKAGLFSAVVAIPVRPDRILHGAFESPLPVLGTSIVRAVVSAWDRPAVRPVATALVRSALGGGARGRPMREYLVREIAGRLSGRLAGEPGVGAEEARLRAELALAQVAGMLVARYLLALEPLASLCADEVVARVGPAVQWHLDGRRKGGLDGAVGEGFNSSCDE